MVLRRYGRIALFNKEDTEHTLFVKNVIMALETGMVANM